MYAAQGALRHQERRQQQNQQSSHYGGRSRSPHRAVSTMGWGHIANRNSPSPESRSHQPSPPPRQGQLTKERSPSPSSVGSIKVTDGHSIVIVHGGKATPPDSPTEALTKAGTQKGENKLNHVFAPLPPIEGEEVGKEHHDKDIQKPMRVSPVRVRATTQLPHVQRKNSPRRKQQDDSSNKNKANNTLNGNGNQEESANSHPYKNKPPHSPTGGGEADGLGTDGLQAKPESTTTPQVSVKPAGATTVSVTKVTEHRPTPTPTAFGPSSTSTTTSTTTTATATIRTHPPASTTSSANPSTSSLASSSTPPKVGSTPPKRKIGKAGAKSVRSPPLLLREAALSPSVSPEKKETTDSPLSHNSHSSSNSTRDKSSPLSTMEKPKGKTSPLLQRRNIPHVENVSLTLPESPPGPPERPQPQYPIVADLGQGFIHIQVDPSSPMAHAISEKDNVLSAAVEQGDFALVTQICLSNFTVSDPNLVLIAAERGDVKIAEKLVECGAAVTVKDNRGRTPLHLAAMNGHMEMCQFLWQNGADKSSKDKQGLSPVDVAKNRNVANYLRQRGGRSLLAV